MSIAILVIDVQQVFRDGEYQAFDVERVIANINRVTDQARTLGHPVVFIQHSAESGPFASGSAGWQFARDLSIAPQDHIVGKTSTDSFHASGLHALLKELDATELVVCGIQSDFCVDSTVRRALALGYDVRLVQDAHTTLDNGVLTAAQISAHHGKTLTSIRSFTGKARLVTADGVF